MPRKAREQQMAKVWPGRAEEESFTPSHHPSPAKAVFTHYIYFCVRTCSLPSAALVI